MKRGLPAWIVSAALVFALPSPGAAQRHAPAGGGSGPAAAPRSSPAPVPAPAPNAGRDSGHGQERATSRRPSEKTDNADKSNQSPASNDNGSTSAARRRGNQPQTGQAAARPSPPPNGEHGGHGHGGGIAAGYPWWSNGYYGGYYAYDPWLGWYPTYDPVSSGGGRDVTGAVRLKVKPEDASVYVDGYYVGLVDDFDGAFQRLRLEPGQHHMEVRLPDYDDLSFDVLIQPGQTTTYHGTMHREE